MQNGTTVLVSQNFLEQQEDIFGLALCLAETAYSRESTRKLESALQSSLTRFYRPMIGFIY